MESRSGPTVRYHGGAVILGETRLDPWDADFHREGVADVWPSVAFPRVPLGIRSPGASPVFGDANTAILFPVGRPYRRISIDGGGSWTEWIEIRPDVLADMVSVHRARGTPTDAVPFGSGGALAPARTHLAHRRARRLLEREGVVDVLALEESALGIVADVLAARLALVGCGANERTHRDRLMRDLVFDVQALLNRRLGCALSLADVSDAVDVSPYHLCRVFREYTGVPIHRYRDELRLRASLERIAERDASLLDIALELGYANEAHFSGAFRRSFGVRPGAFRRSESLRFNRRLRASSRKRPARNPVSSA
jgi:AraC-like DNA-binding protein